MEAGIPARLTPAEGRKFGLTVGTAFVVLGGVVHWRRPGSTVAMTFWAIGAALILGGLAIPGKLGPVYRAWMGLALLLSKVTTPIFMGLVYFVVLMPVGLIKRTFGTNSLVRPTGATYWIAHRKGRGDLERQF